MVEINQEIQRGMVKQTGRQERVAENHPGVQDIKNLWEARQYEDHT